MIEKLNSKAMLQRDVVCSFNTVKTPCGTLQGQEYFSWIDGSPYRVQVCSRGIPVHFLSFIIGISHPSPFD